MEKKMKESILASRLLYKHQKIIIALSGGADSIALLEILYRLQKEYELELVAVHVHHGIREEAYKDVALCEQACSKRDIPLYVEYRDIPSISMEQGISWEEAGRNERYQIFDMYMERLGFENIAIAHHMNDRAETMLFQLFRGSGLKGLTGIPSTRGPIIRPLIGVSRTEIENFLENEQIPYITDATNLEAKYTRNRIRNEMIPIAEEIVSQAMLHMNQTADQLLEVLDYMQIQVDAFVKEHVMIGSQGRQIEVPIEKLMQQHVSLQKMIILKLIEQLLLTRKNITNRHVGDILELLSKEGEKQISLPKGAQVLKSYDKLIFKMQEQNDVESFVELSLGGVYSFGDGLNIELSLEKVDEKANILEKIPQNDCTKWFDYDRIHLPLSLRTRQTGDYFTIDPSGKKKSLKAYMIDEKIPKHMRDQIWLIADGEHILWILGKRISSHYKVTSDTKNILKVHIGGYHGL
ncbi:MAG: tRNA lysidine(34) synthetase TilS [Lachnospiraceae bacterium]